MSRKITIELEEQDWNVVVSSLNESAGTIASLEAKRYGGHWAPDQSAAVSQRHRVSDCIEQKVLEARKKPEVIR